MLEVGDNGLTPPGRLGRTWPVARDDDSPSPARTPVTAGSEAGPSGSVTPAGSVTSAGAVTPAGSVTHAGAAADGPPVGLTNTRTAHTWVAVSAGLFFLVVVLVFILQNLRSVRVHFFWATWTIPLAVDLLLATVLGGLVVFTIGSLRIVQLRRAAHRTARK